MPGSMSVTIRDAAQKTATARFPIPEATTATYDTMAAAIFDLRVGIAASVLGYPERWRWVGKSVTGSTAPPASLSAQRELKWLLSYTDSVTGRSYSCELGCADVTLRTPSSDDMDLTSGPGLALKTAFDAFARSPYGNAVSLTRAVLVGRNV